MTTSKFTTSSFDPFGEDPLPEPTTTYTFSNPLILVPTALPTRTGSLSLPLVIPGERPITSGFDGRTSVVNIVTMLTHLSGLTMTPYGWCKGAIVATMVEPEPETGSTSQRGASQSKSESARIMYAAGCQGNSAGWLENCLPTGALSLSRTSVNVSPNVLVQTRALFSPALACPVGYASACDLGPLGAAQTYATYVGGAPEQTALACCPEGFQCGTADSYCSKPLTSGQVVIASLCGGKQQDMTIADDKQHMVAQPLYIVTHVPTNLPHASTNSSSAGPLSSLGLSSSQGQGQGISPALQAAVGVSVSLGVILLGLIGFLIFRYKRRRAARIRALDKMDEKDKDETSQGGLYEAHGSPRQIEVDAKDTEKHVYELPGSCLPEFPEDAFSPTEAASEEVEKKVAEDAKQVPSLPASASNLPSPAISSPTEASGSTMGSLGVSINSTRRFSFEQDSE